MSTNDNTTRRRFLSGVTAALAGSQIVGQVTATPGEDGLTITGSVRGVVDGRVALRGQNGGTGPREQSITYDDVEFHFEDVPAGAHQLQVFENDGRGNQIDGNGAKLLQEKVTVEPDATFEYHLDNIRGVFAVAKPLEEMKTEIDRYGDLGITDLYLRSMHLYQVLYPSDVAPKKGEFGEDYFETVIDYAHRQGLRVHAWVHCFYAWNFKYLGDVPSWHPLAGDDLVDYSSPYFDEQLTVDRDLVTARADGTVVSEDGKVFASPFSETATGFMLDVYEEMLDEYDLDGLNLDYIRFPGFRYYDADGDGDSEFVDDPYGFGPSSPLSADADYETGLDARVGAVTAFVEAVGDRVGDDVILSADVFNSFYTDPEGERLNRNKSQDWQSWMGTSGVDWFHPMIYKSIYGFDALTDGIEFALGTESDGATVMPGLTNIGGHESIEAQWTNSVSEFDIPGYIVFKGDTIETLDSLP
jgi:uncharacterized lipoprotein YddW (UPF0748 family)